MNSSLGIIESQLNIQPLISNTQSRQESAENDNMLGSTGQGYITRSGRIVKPVDKYGQN